MMKKGTGMRRVRFHVILGLLVCGIVMGGTARVCSQDLDVTPTGWDYGNVPVGTSETVTFHFTSLGPTAVWTYVTLLTTNPGDPLAPVADPKQGSYTLGAFSYNPLTYPILPREMPKYDEILVDVIFTPPTPGDYSVYLFVQSNDSYDPPGPHAFFLLEGTGIAASVPEPATVLLLGSGLIGVAGIRRRMKK